MALRPAPDPVKSAEFMRQNEAERRARVVNSVPNDPYLVCAKCAWQISDREARARGIQRCPRCGSRECKVHSLPYEAGGSIRGDK